MHLTRPDWGHDVLKLFVTFRNRTEKAIPSNTELQLKSGDLDRTDARYIESCTVVTTAMVLHDQWGIAYLKEAKFR